MDIIPGTYGKNYFLFLLIIKLRFTPKPLVNLSLHLFYKYFYRRLHYDFYTDLL